MPLHKELPKGPLFSVPMLMVTSPKLVTYLRLILSSTISFPLRQINFTALGPEKDCNENAECADSTDLLELNSGHAPTKKIPA